MSDQPLVDIDDVIRPGLSLDEPEAQVGDEQTQLAIRAAEKRAEQEIAAVRARARAEVEALKRGEAPPSSLPPEDYSDPVGMPSAPLPSVNRSLAATKKKINDLNDQMSKMAKQQAEAQQQFSEMMQIRQDTLKSWTSTPSAASPPEPVGEHRKAAISKLFGRN